jgi:OOP family OmpA-OmpF porin
MPTAAPARFEEVTRSATELFAVDHATLSLPQPELDAIAAALASAPDIAIIDLVGHAGHAGRPGAANTNQTRWQQSAKAVRDDLVAPCVAAARLKACGAGGNAPVVTRTMPRRAELIECPEPKRRLEVEQVSVERRVQ